MANTSETRTCFALVALLVTPLSILGGDTASTVGVIESRWKSKERSVEKAVFSWKDRITAPKSDLLSMERKGRGEKVESEDTEFEQSTSLTLYGERWRVDSESKAYNLARDFIAQKETAVYADGILKTYMPKGAAANPAGNIDKASQSTIPKVLHMRPLFLIYRPLTARLVDPMQCKVPARTALIQDRKCILLESTPPGLPKSTFYLAPDMDYAILRWTVGTEVKINLQCDFYYKQDLAFGWVPERWTSVSITDKETMQESIASTVKSYQIGGPLDASVFEFTFPPGTLVRDYTQKSEWAPDVTASHVAYIALEGGEKRIVTKSDSKATYDELLNSESGMAKAPKSTVSNLLILLIVSCAGAGIAGFMVFYRKWRTGKWMA